MDTKAKDIIKRFLTIDRTNRLGCMKGSSRSVKEHKWFSGLDWDAVYNGQVEAPFLPKVEGNGDSSNFESYPESVDDDCPTLTAEEAALFEDLEKF